MTNRDIILNNLREAIRIPSRMADEKADASQKVLAGVKAATPKDIKEMWLQFKDELEKVAGEYHEFNNSNEIADLVVNVLMNSNYRSLVVNGHKIGQEIVASITKKLPDLEIINVADLTRPQRREKLALADAAVLDTSFAIADIGAIVLFPGEIPGVYAHILPECIFIVIKQDQLLPNLFDLVTRVPKENMKTMLMVTGPSRTADVEKILILGAHGPKRLIVAMYKK